MMEPEQSISSSLAAEAVRLQKHLAALGVGSRRFCETLIAAGRVTVDGTVVCELGTKVLPTQHVSVDGRTLQPEALRYFLADKPAGILCTSSDPQGRETIIQWAKKIGMDPNIRLYTVGRLDRDSEGLIVLTNDGNFAQAMAHPRHHIQKEYLVWPSRHISPEDIKAFLRGVKDEGETLRALSVSLKAPRPDGRPAPAHIILGEGRNRHIRRMLASCDIRIRRLRRIRIGFLTEGSLKKSPFRELTPIEIQRLLFIPSAPLPTQTEGMNGE